MLYAILLIEKALIISQDVDILKISEKKLNHQTMVYIDGDLNTPESVKELESIVDRLLDDGENEIILNIDDTRVITPTGLGTILKF